MGKNTRLTFIIAAASGFILLIAILLLQKNKATDGVSNEVFSIEEVSMGPVVSSLQTSGVVESDDEIIIRSPERSTIKKVYKNAGTLVKKGELLIELDEKSVNKEIERINNQLEIKLNSLEKSRLNAQSTRLSLDRNEEAKKLRIVTLKSNLAEQEKMLEAGTISEERVDRTRQEIESAENDLESQKEKDAIRIQQMEADEKGLLMQINSQEQNLKEKQAMLSKLRIKAPVEGVILAINSNEGQRIEDDAMLLRMSDMSSFKVVGWVHEKYASRIQTGNRVLVNLDNEKLEGVVGEITPMIEDQMINFNVHLNDKKHPGLKINQSVALEIISRSHDDVLRIKKLPEFGNSNRQFFYVLNDHEAIKTEVILGTIGNEWCEIVSGLNKGDQILIGSTNAETGPDKFRLKKNQLQ